MKDKCKITIGDDILWARKGENLGEILKGNGYDFSMPCGGKGICRKCKVIVDGREALACKYLVVNDINVVIPKVGNIVDSDISEGDIKVPQAYIAIDLGSTSIAMALVDGKSKKTLRKKSFDNPEKVFGADVISRIEYCVKNGVRPLTDVLCKRLCKELDGFADEDTFLTHIYVSGNTVMLHTLLGEDCSGMGFAPYTPVFLGSRTVKAKELGLNYDCDVTTLPCVSSFVGGDTVAGLLTLPCPREGKYGMLIDMGTNAEIVLFGKDEYLAAAASAGPCFEGAGISCGMTASDGAITHFVYPDKVTVIGEKAKGLCGTGLIDAVAQLYKNGVIDYTGYMNDDYYLAENVVLTKEDIRQFQLAKSAIRAGAEILIEKKGISKDDIDTLYLAGGFSDFIDIKNAVACGLIDKAFEDKCKCVGNSSLQGCVIYLFNKDKADKIASCAKYIDLTECEDFSDKFINYIFLDR